MTEEEGSWIGYRKLQNHKYPDESLQRVFLESEPFLAEFCPGFWAGGLEGRPVWPCSQWWTSLTGSCWRLHQVCPPCWPGGSWPGWLEAATLPIFRSTWPRYPGPTWGPSCWVWRAPWWGSDSSPSTDWGSSYPGGGRRPSVLPSLWVSHSDQGRVTQPPALTEKNFWQCLIAVSFTTHRTGICKITRRERPWRL